eukprot:763022-Amphidinium_carterae.2
MDGVAIAVMFASGSNLRQVLHTDSIFTRTFKDKKRCHEQSSVRKNDNGLGMSVECRPKQGRRTIGHCPVDICPCIHEHFHCLLRGVLS